MLGPGLKSSIRNAAFAVGASTIGSAIRFVLVIALARGLGPADYGAISSLQAFYLMFVFASTAGLAAYLAREIAAGGAREAQAAGATLALEAGVLALSALLFLAVAGWGDAGGGGAGAGAAGGDAALALLFALTLPARGLAIWARQLFLAREMGGMPLRLVVWFRGAELAVSLAALALGAGVTAIVALHFLSWLAEAAYALGLLRRRGLLGAVSASGLWGRLRPAAPALLGASLTFASADWLRSSPIVLHRFLGEDAEALGRFAFAWNASLILSTTMVVALSAAFPVVSRAHGRADGKDLAFLSFAIRAGLLAGGLATIGGLGLGREVIVLLGGEAYGAAAPAFVASLATIGPITAAHALDQRLFLDGRLRAVLGLNLAALVLLAALFGPLLRQGGAEAATLGAFGVLLAMAAAKLEMARRAHGRRLAQEALRALAAAAIGVGAALAAQGFGPLATLTAGVAALVLAAAALGLATPGERAALAAALRRGLGGVRRGGARRGPGA